jgi:hypothetical protein
MHSVKQKMNTVGLGVAEICCARLNSWFVWNGTQLFRSKLVYSTSQRGRWLHTSKTLSQRRRTRVHTSVTVKDATWATWLKWHLKRFLCNKIISSVHQSRTVSLPVDAVNSPSRSLSLETTRRSMVGVPGTVARINIYKPDPAAVLLLYRFALPGK